MENETLLPSGQSEERIRYFLTVLETNDESNSLDDQLLVLGGAVSFRCFLVTSEDVEQLDKSLLK